MSKQWTVNDLRAHLFNARHGKSFNQWHDWLKVNRIAMWQESGLSEQDFGQAVEAASMDTFNALRELRFPDSNEESIEMTLSPIPPQLTVRTTL